MQSRRKLLIIIVASILVLLLAGAATLLVRGFLQLQEVDASLQTASETLTSLYAQNPFPSGGNLRLERENIKSIGEELLGLQLAMSEGQVEPIAQSPAKCITQFWETRNSLLARAGGTVKIDKGFDFGFGRHMKGDLPSIQDVPRIAQQLKIVETLCSILYASKITALTWISRQEFESDAALAALPGKPASGTTAAKAGADIVVKNVADATAGLIPAGQLYGRWHFIVQFTAREGALMKVLNGMSRSPVFIIVTRMEIKGDDKVFDRKEAEAVAAKSAERNEDAGAKEAVKPRDARVVCGRDALVNVKLELDVYQFAKPQTNEPEKKLGGVK
ncbi:MAG: Amuc_1100 family pilus-like protein [bacterium]